jgi:SAM-dependent methyltransferase
MKGWDNVFRRDGKYYTEPAKEVVKFTKLLKSSKAKRVLDIGCGSGRHVVYLASQGFDVYGFDQSPTGIKITKRWLSDENLKAKVIVRSMNRKFPYKDGFFDAMISIQVLHHNHPKTIKKVIEEIERVLKPKGMLFFTVPMLRQIANKKFKKIGFRTYLPTRGDEMGITHFYFNEKLIKEFFNNFTVRINVLRSGKFNRRFYGIIAIKK